VGGRVGCVEWQKPTIGGREEQAAGEKAVSRIVVSAIGRWAAIKSQLGQLYPHNRRSHLEALWQSRHAGM